MLRSLVKVVVKRTVRQRCMLLSPQCHTSFTRDTSTVFAHSSGRGKCGVGVVRVSGDQAATALTRMTLPAILPQPRHATLRRIVHPTTRETLDHGLVLWFPGPHSFTGEDSCELHVHGGPAVIVAVLAALGKLPGFVPAQPGDFTKRAFHHNKLDLTSVEGLGDLIHAETEAQRKQALQQMEGALAKLYTGWRRSLLHCRATLEAYIDFSEDENIEEGVLSEVHGRLEHLAEELRLHLTDKRRGERLRSGLQLAILGETNVGKSSLLNALTQTSTAIVSPIPGTTRDVVQTVVDVGGFPVVLSDTAGLRATNDPVEHEGINRAMAKAKVADVAVVVLEAQSMILAIENEVFEWEEYFRSHLAHLGILKQGEECPEWVENQYCLPVINKMDLIAKESKAHMHKTLADACCLISLKTQEGFEGFLERLTGLCGSLCDMGTAENPTLTATRHRTHIASCLDTLNLILHPYHTEQCVNDSKGSSSSHMGPMFKVDKGLSLVQTEDTVVVAAHLLHQAATSLGHVTGHITTEDVLDHIFSAFCIGK